MFEVNVPIFQGGAEFSRIRRAKRSTQKSRYNLEEQRNLIREAVVRAIHDLRVSNSVIKTYKANVETAEAALEGLNHEVQVGVRTTIDLLDAEEELFQARVLYLRAKRDRIVNAYNLLAQTGRLGARQLDLDVGYHDPDGYYDNVKYKLFTDVDLEKY